MNFFCRTGSGAFLNNLELEFQKKNFETITNWNRGPRSNSKIKNEIYLEYLKVSQNIEIPIRKFGSASLDLASVASGRYDGFWQRELHYWDIAAGIIIVKEAGGFIDFLENDVTSTKKEFSSYKFINSSRTIGLN